LWTFFLFVNELYSSKRFKGLEEERCPGLKKSEMNNSHRYRQNLIKEGLTHVLANIYVVRPSLYRSSNNVIITLKSGSASFPHKMVCSLV
jgi:hypothetical protein